VQIYFDFSGYSDMAIGLGLMLGFHFPANFLSPYRAWSITEFWRRWHVSLSTWLRDYLYVPLGGNRRGPMRTYVNLALVMLLGGLWHGAAWTFLLWGAWQGLFLILERRAGGHSPYGFLPRPMQVLCTFVIVVFGWVIFKAENLAQLSSMWRGMVGMHGLGAVPSLGEQGPIAYGPCCSALGSRSRRRAVICSCAASTRSSCSGSSACLSSRSRSCSRRTLSRSSTSSSRRP
jgi:alginate O-acetyltransferase complex protein AlgI